MLRDRMRGHMDEIEAMPGMRQWHRDEEAKEHARDLEIERVYEETLEEHMSGDSETSYLTEIIERDVANLHHEFMDALRQSLTDEAEAGKKLKAIYTKAAEIYAQEESERVI